MILTAHQTAYLPWLGLFHKIAICDVYCYLDNVQFSKNSFENRNKIKTAQGPIWLTVPVLAQGHFDKAVKEIEIDNGQNWQKKHQQAIFLAYKKAPYFAKHAPFLEKVYQTKWQFLSQLNRFMLEYFLKELNIETKIVLGSDLAVKEKKQKMVMGLCQALGAKAFLFGQNGKNYASRDDFKKAGLKIEFQEYHHPKYQQLWGEFAPYMSVLDLLFNHGPKSLEIIMQNNLTKNQLCQKFLS